jgi:ABC-2 type transport system ATP-binding protein
MRSASPAVEAERGGGRRGREREEADGVLIRTRHLTKRYGDLVAVDHLNLEVKAGEIFGLLGPNGAGKTTTVLMLLGLSEPSSGEARVLGLDPTRHPLEIKRQVGYLPDSVGFYGAMTGRENLRYTARLNGMEGKEAELIIGEVLEQAGLTADADRKVEEYSRGMKQRLGIADALVKNPRILILDEPTTAIDPVGVTEILDLIRRLVDERGIAILLASHLLDQVQSVCDRVGIFQRGRMIASGTVADLARQFGAELNQLEVAVEGDGPAQASRVAELLAQVPGVASVRRVGHDEAARLRGWLLDRHTLLFTVELARDADPRRVRQDMVVRIVDAGLRLERLGQVSPSLGDIYRRAEERAAGKGHPSTRGEG